MFEESVATIPSLIASINSWLTPTVLFVLLNVVIATIAFTSTLSNQNNHQQQQQQKNHQHHHRQQQQEQEQEQEQINSKLPQSPSFLQRVRSINFSINRSQESSANLVNNVKIAPDSNTLFNLEHTHLHETHENPSHYIFEQPLHQGDDDNVMQMQYNLYPGQESNTLYDFEHTHQLETSLNPNPSYYSFEHPRNNQTESNVSQGNSQQMNTHTQYFFQQAHEEKRQETSNQFVIDEKDQEIFEEDEVGELKSLDEVYGDLSSHHISRTKSDTEPASGEVPVKLPTKMRKSASLKSPFSHFEEEDIVETRRPATVRERGGKSTEVDHEVDAKADDFINKFKNQLKLQRIDSIIRYKDMVNRGSEK